MLEEHNVKLLLQATAFAKFFIQKTEVVGCIKFYT